MIVLGRRSGERRATRSSASPRTPRPRARRGLGAGEVERRSTASPAARRRRRRADGLTDLRRHLVDAARVGPAVQVRARRDDAPDRRARRAAASGGRSGTRTPIASGSAPAEPAEAARRVREDERVRARQQRAGDHGARPRSSGTRSSSTSRSRARSADRLRGSRRFSAYSRSVGSARSAIAAEAVDGVGRQDHRLARAAARRPRRSSACLRPHGRSRRGRGVIVDVVVAGSPAAPTQPAPPGRRRPRARANRVRRACAAIVSWKPAPTSALARLVAAAPAAGRRASRRTAGSRRRGPSRRRGRSTSPSRSSTSSSSRSRVLALRARGRPPRRRRRRRARPDARPSSASAIAPEPTPTSSTRGASMPSRSTRARSTTISVSGRGTSARASVFSISRRKPHSPSTYASGSRAARRSTQRLASCRRPRVEVARRAPLRDRAERVRDEELGVDARRRRLRPRRACCSAARARRGRVNSQQREAPVFRGQRLGELVELALRGSGRAGAPSA